MPGSMLQRSDAAGNLAQGSDPVTIEMDQLDSRPLNNMSQMQLVEQQVINPSSNKYALTIRQLTMKRCFLAKKSDYSLQ